MEINRSCVFTVLIGRWKQRALVVTGQLGWKPWLAQGVILMLLGALAGALPLLGTLAVELVVGWLFAVGGVVRLAGLGWSSRPAGYWWSMLSALLAVFAVIILVVWPLQGVITLTLVLMALFIVEGVTALLVVAAMNPGHTNRGWLLFSGVIDFVLVFLIWQGWPATAAWAIGLLAGVDLLFPGLSMMIAFAARTASDEG